MSLLLFLHFIITIAVVDDTGAPIERAAIDNGYGVVYTDSLGMGEIDGPPGMITISRMGYETIVMSSGDLSGPVDMRRAPRRIPGIRVVNRYTGRVIEPPVGAAGSVADALQAQADVFARESAPGAPQTVSLQGGRERHVQVWLDGVALNRAGQPFDLSSIPAADIERIEVVTGPSPGASGMDGAVFLWSRRDAQSSASAGVSSGSFGARGLQQQLTLADDRLSTTLRHTHEESEGDFPFTHPFSGEAMRRGNNDSRSDLTSVQMQWRGKATVQADWRLHDRRRGLPGPIGQQTNFDAATMREELERLQIEAKLRDWELRLVDDRERTHFRNIGSTNPFYAAEGVTISRIDQLSLAHSFDWRSLRLRMLADARRETFRHVDRINPSGDIDEKRHDNLGCEGELAWSRTTGDWTWSADLTLRNDWSHARTSEAQGSGRVDFVADWATLVPLRFTLSAGESYTPPSFFDLHWKGDSQAAGNPDLRPETSRGAQCGVEADTDLFTLSAEAALRYYDDLIFWSRSPLGWKPLNLDAAEKRIFTLSGEVRPWGFIQLSGSWRRVFAWDRSLDDNGEHGDHWGKNLTYTPSSQTQARLALTPGDWRLDASWRCIGRRWTSRDNLRGAMPAYTVLDASLAWSPYLLGADWRLQAGCDNIRDRRYEIYDAEPMPGRSWNASISVKAAL